MKKPSKFIKTKVTAGYLLLTSVLLFSIWFIYREMEMLSAPDIFESELTEKRKATNNTLAKLFKTEAIGLSLSTGEFDDYPLYVEAMQESLASIDTLKTFATDSMQLQRIDSIYYLLIQKEENMISLLETMNDETDELYQRNIDKIIADQEALLNQKQVKQKVVVQEDTYQVKKKPKKFFKRLAEAFVPDKKDSSTVTKTSREFVSDTLSQPYNPADTVAVILRNIQAQLKGKKEAMRDQLREKVDELRYNNQILTSKINQIIREFEEEEVNISIIKVEQSKTIRQRSMSTISGIAVTSALLAAFFLVLIWRDIARSTHYRRELEIAKKRAEDLLITREKLMLTITHDIKAPIGSIMGYTELLSGLTHEDKQLLYLSNMKSSSEHLLKLVNNLLDFHRLDSNKMEVNQSTFNPKQLFDEIKTSFEPLATKKKLQLNYRISPELNHLFVCDPFRIRQIADNLLSNAIKFTKKGNITLWVSYQDSNLHFSVSDTGSGISQEEQEKIFKEFTRLQSAQGEEGFGLGLSITQKLTILLGGSISVDSIPGQGSTFEVHIPIQPATESKKEIPSSKKMKEKPIELDKDIRILMIDDDRIQLDLTVAMLKQQNIEVVCCEQPEELVEHLAKGKFDFLLTDVQMPAISGFELLAKLRESAIQQAREIPVIAVTARSDMDEEYFKSKGFAGCLHKPFSMAELFKIISVSSLKESEDASLNKDKEDQLNLDKLTAFSEDDPEAARQILQTFVIETKKNVQALEQALEKSDATIITALAHKILPLFRMINAKSCIEPLIWLEKQKGKTFSKKMKEETNRAIKEINLIIDMVESSVSNK